MVTGGGLAPWLEDVLAGLDGELEGIPALLAASAAIPLPPTELVGIEWAPDDPRASLSLHVQLATGSGQWVLDPEATSGLTDPAGLGLDHLRELITRGLAGGERGFVCEAGEGGGARLTAIYTSHDPAGDDWRSLANVFDVLAVSSATVAALHSRPLLHGPSHIGVMAQRRGPGARLVFYVRPDEEEFWASVASLPQAPSQALAAARNWLDDGRWTAKVHLNIDLHEGRCGPRVGIELPLRSHVNETIREGSVVATHGDEGLGVELVKRGLLELRQLDTLTAWQGRRLVDRQARELPVAQMLDALAAGGALVEIRTINHVKLVFEQGQQTTAKTYLKVMRAPAHLRQPPDRANEPSVGGRD